MTVRLEEDVVFLDGTCPVEDAETLISLLDIKPDRIVDLTGCASLLRGAIGFARSTGVSAT